MMDISCLLLLGAFGLVWGKCPSLQGVIGQAEYCASFLAEPRNDSLLGLFTESLQKDACGEIYDDTMNCIKDLKMQCQHSPNELQQATAKEVAIQSGFGQLCENTVTFQRYLEFADCYMMVSEKTLRCWNAYQKGTHDALKSDREYYDEEDPLNKFCNLFLDLESCDESVIKPQCGNEAAKLFRSLRRTEVPSHILGSTCSDDPTTPPGVVKPPAKDSHTSTAAPTTSTAKSAVVIAFLLVFVIV